MCENVFDVLDAVYSTEFTASKPPDDDNHPCYMHRLPFFVANQRLMDSRDERNDRLLEQIDHLQSQSVISVRSNC
jgi:hypothetical protein